MTPGHLFTFLAAASALWLAARAHETRGGFLQKLIRRFRALFPAEKVFLPLFVIALCIHGGSKTNAPAGAPAPPEHSLQHPDSSLFTVDSSLSPFDYSPLPVDYSLLSSSTNRLTPGQYAAGFALVSVSTNAAPWPDTPSNAVPHPPWTVYGVAEDTFWLPACAAVPGDAAGRPATGWSFILGTNAADGLHVSSSGLASFGNPLSTPDPASVPANASLLAPLHGSLGTVPPQGRFWHAPTPSNSLLLTWENVLAGRDPDAPASFQAELFRSGDFTFRYAFPSNSSFILQPSYFPFVVGALHNGGGEVFALNDPSALADGLELRWRAFGPLDPENGDHDGDGLPDYDEVFLHGTGPAMPDTDLDGLSDSDEINVHNTCPLARDTDGDTIPDGSDPAPLDPGSGDLDGDGLPDAWEVFRFGGTNVTDDASADADGDGFSNLAAMLAGIDPAFAAFAVTASHGGHAFAWTALPGATNHSAAVTRGGAQVWSCATNAFSVSVTGDFSTASHTLTVTSCGPTSRTASVTFRQPSQPNLTVWKIAGPFALDIPPGMTNILEITVPVARSGAWQQYFVSSGHDAAGAWALEGMRLEWSDSGGGSGYAAASPPGDSLRLAVSTNGPQSLTVRIVPDGAGGIARSPKPLHLLAWSPAVTLDAPPGTPSVPFGEGAALVALSDRSGGPSGVSFSVGLSGRPHNAAPGQDERDGLSLPFGQDGSFSGTFAPDGSLTGGTVSAGGPGVFPLASSPSPAGAPPGGAAFRPGPPPPPPDTPPSALILISPLVTREGGRRACCGTRGTYAYPFDSDCMSSAWNGLDYGGCPDAADGFSFTMGSEALDALFTLKTGGEPGSRHLWEDGEDTRRASAELEGEEVWSATVEREPAMPCAWFSESWETDGCGDTCPGCAGGGCGGEDGDSSGSARFRVSLGRDPRGRPYGFVWFVMREPAEVTPALFAVSAIPAVAVERSGGTGPLSRASCALPGGRDVRVEPAAGGVRVSARDTGASAEDAAWTITSQNNSVRFERTDASANLVSDATHTRDIWQGCPRWTRADAVSGSLNEIVSWTYPDGGGYRRETAHAGGAVASVSETETAVIGSGPAAAEREILRSEWDGASASFRETRMSWRADSLNAMRNGRPRLMERDGGAWEFRNQDSRGRDTLTATPLDGSAPPAALTSGAADPETAPQLAALAGAACLAVTHSYTPVPGSGDTAHYLDSRQPRETVAWAVRDGQAVTSAREWRAYTRFASDGVPALAVRTVRAASAASAYNDPANAVSLSISHAGAENPEVPEELRNLPLREEREDGAVLTRAYETGDWSGGVFTPDPYGEHLRVTALEGTAEHPSGIPGASAWTVEIRDPSGLALRRETRLCDGTAAGPLLAWEDSEYDQKGHLLSTAFSDGSALSNLWGCCRLDAALRRDGTRSETWEIPGFPLWSAEAETSLGNLPGADGAYPVTETFRDSAGRVTNTVRSVWKNGSRDTAFAPLATRTEYPYGTDNYRVTTDPLGVQTVSCKYYGSNCEIEETASAGITSRVTRVHGGATVKEKYWDGKWTRENHSTSYDASGCRIETVTEESSDYPARVASVTARDFLGRAVSVTTPLGVTSNFYSGASDRVVRVSRTGQPDTLYEYEAGSAGVPARTVLDVDGDGAIGCGGPDRITSFSETYGEDASNVWWRVTTGEVWAYTNSAASVTSAVTRVRMTGLGTPAPASVSENAILTAQTETLDWRGNVTRVSTYTDAGAATVWTVTETPGSVQPAIQKTVAGHTVSMVSSTAVTNTYTFDGFGRQVSSTDGRGNTTVTAYNELGQVAYTEDAASNRTAYAYDASGRQNAVTPPLSNTVFTAYDSLGNVTAQWGGTYPVEYGYDTRNRKVSMKTFRVENGNGDETRWLYDNATGLLTNKVYADGSRVVYAYTAAGRLASRVWARGVTTDYAYDALGQLAGIGYSDATPDISFAYDRMGNMVSVTDASGTRVFAHDLDGQTLSDTLSALGRDFVLLESRDMFGRGTGYALSNTVDGITSHIAGTSITYDPFGRIAHVSVDGIAAPFVCGYLSGTDLQRSLVMPNGVTRETVYEPCRDLTSSVVHTNAGGTVLTRRTFTRDASGNLTARTQYRLGDETNRVDVFSQNARDELVYAALGTNGYAYAFDPIGNRLSADEPLFSAAYSANALNQYSVISNFVDSMPSCEFIPEFDQDGNQTLLKTATGIWHVSYNAENRPVLFSNDTAVVEMRYDYMGRRFEYKETVVGAVTHHERHLYRGYLRVAALDLLDGTNVLHTIAWDPSEPVATRPLALLRGTNWWSYGFDQVKNVTELFEASGVLAATYDYAPFGAVIASSGSAAAVNPIMFSSEICDAVLGLVYYNYRPLETLDGRWINRDLIEEDGGLNLYEYVVNNSVLQVDALGLSQTKPTIPQTGFAVIANVVEIESVVGKILQTLGVDHVDITYNGAVIYVGAHGGIARQNPKSKIVNNVYPLQKRRSGYLKYGTSDKCLKCKNATDSQVVQCLQKRKPNLGMNCQGDVQGAASDCCLTGFRTFVSTVFPYWD